MSGENIEIHVSDFCNRNCSFCVSKHENRLRQMSVQTAQDLLSKLKLNVPMAVTFSGGGEPTTNNQIFAYLADGLMDAGAKCGLTTNGWQTGANTRELEWVRLSVYGVNCRREIENVLACRAKKHNAALFYKGIEDLRKYVFLLDAFDEVTVKTLNDCKPLTDDETRAIVELGFKCKQNPRENDFAECKFGKPCYDPDGKVHKCCLCKAAGGFFGVDRCTVPCVMYNSNKSGELIINKYGFAI